MPERLRTTKRIELCLYLKGTFISTKINEIVECCNLKQSSREGNNIGFYS